MFTGSKFTKKNELAMEFAKKILCLGDNPINCNECKSCIEITNNNHPDFSIIELENDEKSIKIEQIRKLQENIIKKPIISKKQVYIIKNSESMTIGAQNCLLKTLEEPPAYATIILLVENENMILNTIKSRCTKISFTDEEEKNFTEEQEELYNKLDKILSNVKNYSLLDALNDLEFIYKSDKNINEILEYINMIFYKNIKKNVENIYYIDIVEETKNRLKLNANYNMTIDNMIFSIFKYI
jgi:DNA polymerase-3 subunit delta'